MTMVRDFVVAAVLVLSGYQGTAQGNTIYVPDDYVTIQGAIDAAVDFDTVIVRAGTWAGTIDFKGKAIAVSSSRGPALTTIDGCRTGKVVTFVNSEISLSSLDGFTISNGDARVSPTREGGGIYCNGASPRIARNVIGWNHADGGGGIACAESAAPIIVNNIIRANSCGLGGGGGLACFGASPIVTNNTFFDNVSNGPGGGIRSCDASPSVTNCIVRANSPDQIHAPDAVGSYCNVEGGRPGLGNIDADPLFVDSAGGDFHLLYDSPCVGKGLETAPHLPAVDFDGDPRDVQGGIEMGADEFHLHLYFSGIIAPGADVELRVIGQPGIEPVWALADTELNDLPLNTSYGTLYLEPPVNAHWNMGKIENNGLLVHLLTVPLEVVPGQEYYFQALAGDILSPTARLTNLMTLVFLD